MRRHNLRVIAGRYKGCRLAAPTWAGLRPTSDKLRETLFNILAPRVQGARVLDAFAGTGALGIEALSRGASEVTFVDSDRRAMALIAENVRRCRIDEGYVMMPGDAARVVSSAAVLPFDLVLVDPPYDLPEAERFLEEVGAVLAPGGLLVFEHARRRPVPETIGGLRRVREVVSGDSALAFFVRGPEGETVLHNPDHRVP